MSVVQSFVAKGRVHDLLAWASEDLIDGSKRGFSLAVHLPDRSMVASTPETSAARFMYRCFQDAVIAAMIVALAHDGALSLEDPAASYVPELFGLRAHDCPIRLSHLLSRSSGLWLEAPPPKIQLLKEWAEFCAVFAPAVPRFTPGTVVTHTLIERLILLQILRRVLRDDPYSAMQERFFANSGSMRFRTPEGPFNRCYAEIEGAQTDVASFVEQAFHSPWIDCLPGAEARPIVQHARAKDWAPVGEALGLFVLANGIWGRDGDDPSTGFLGFRLSPVYRTAVFGHFRTPYQRERVLGRVCSDLMDVAYQPRTHLLGHLNGIAAADLAGPYKGVGGHLAIEVDGPDRLVLKFGASGQQALSAQIGSDDSLSGKWATQGLWIEPQTFCDGQTLGFRFGKHLYLRVQ